MLIPLTHESAEARRWPVVTTALIAVCILVHSAFSVTGPDLEQRAATLLDAAHELARADETLDRSEILALESGDVWPADLAAKPVPDRSEIEDDALREAQEVLDTTVRKAAGAVASLPVLKYGHVTGHLRPFQLLSYAFVHGDWLHVLFNMWFLWLTGITLEDRWGRGPYLGFFLVAAVVSAFGHDLLGGSPGVPMVGASGAIAAGMGAFLVVQAKARIRFVWLIFFRPLLFNAPAYVMLPLWLALELLSGFGGANDGVAHGAHIGGFFFGLAVGGVLRFSGMEKRLDAAVEGTLEASVDPRLEEAAHLIDQKRPSLALDLLGLIASERPNDMDVALLTLRATKELGDPRRELQAYSRLMALYAKSDSPRAAMDLYWELSKANRLDEVAPTVRLHLADSLARGGLFADASFVYEGIHHNAPADELGVRALVGQGRALAEIGRGLEGLRLLDEARQSPFSTVELDALASREMARIRERLATQSA